MCQGHWSLTPRAWCLDGKYGMITPDGGEVVWVWRFVCSIDSMQESRWWNQLTSFCLSSCFLHNWYPNLRCSKIWIYRTMARRNKQCALSTGRNSPVYRTKIIISWRNNPQMHETDPFQCQNQFSGHKNLLCYNIVYSLPAGYADDCESVLAHDSTWIKPLTKRGKGYLHRNDRLSLARAQYRVISWYPLIFWVLFE